MLPAGDLLLAHLRDSHQALDSLAGQLGVVELWAAELQGVLTAGGRLLAAGNGGSAALAHHLTTELVGRYRADRPAFAGLALSADGSALTALGNDYGFEECFARQVAAHGRGGDVLLALSTSGRSPNLLRAAAQARQQGLRIWALSGPPPNPLVASADSAVVVTAPTTAAVQEAHQVAVHLLCLALDQRLSPPAATPVS